MHSEKLIQQYLTKNKGTLQSAMQSLIIALEVKVTHNGCILTSFNCQGISCREAPCYLDDTLHILR